MLLIKDVFHPPSHTVMTADHSLSGVAASKFVDIDCTCKSRNLKIAHMLHNLEAGTQSQDSENAQRNIKIAQIFRLCGTYIYYLLRNEHALLLTDCILLPKANAICINSNM